MIISRPFSFILLALIGLLLLTSFIPFWVSRMHGIEKQVDITTKKSHQQIWSIIRNATITFLPMNSAATNLAKLANESLSRTNLIEPKVAPLLFQALSTIPHLSQISYIRRDGLFFALYSKPDGQVFALYSNTSFSKATELRIAYLWYTQPVDSDTGKLYGDAVVFPPQVLANETWLQRALNATNGYASLGKSFNDPDNRLILNTAGVDENGVISLGFGLKSVVDVFSSVTPRGGGLYLATNNGLVLSDGLPNINAKIVLNKANGDQRETRILDVSGTKYVVYSSALNIIGVQSVGVLALPYDDGLQRRMHENIMFVFVFLSVIFVTVTISIFTFILLAVRSARKEMCLRAALIKQKEATQQAERKSKNHSLAFVTASHDIRASLAGITGLLEMSINDVHQGSELTKNLRLVQICSQDLHGILNSILDTSKIEAGKMQLEEKPFDLANVLEAVVDLFYPVGLKKKVDVILDLEDGSVTRFSQVVGDERRLKQILSNLLSNGIKFTSEGYVSVRAWARKPQLPNSTFDQSKQNQSRRCLPCFILKNDQVHGDFEAINEASHPPDCMEFVFEVNDTGKGIPKEKQTSVFENYVQVQETARELEGTGLGLGIVQSLVRLMGGEISIVNKEVGEKGTCFRFNVVLKVSRSDPEDDKTPKREGCNSIVVLFIGGDERRRMAESFLANNGVKVLAVKNIGQLSQTLKKDITQEQHDICSRNSPASNTNGSNSVFLVIDTTVAEFHELCKAVAEFRKDSKNLCSRVVWLGSRSIQLHGLDEKKLPPSDTIIPMPLHGSRLRSLIGLLPEFGGTSPFMPRRHEDIQEIVSLPDNHSPPRAKRVLLVDDDNVQQRIAKKILLNQNVTIDTCRNGEEALHMVSKGLTNQRNLGASHILPYDYILMDCQMPVMDGCEATKQIRLTEKDYGVHIPIIGLTAHTEGEELTKMFAAGIDIHVSKPLNERKILKVIEDLHRKTILDFC